MVEADPIQKLIHQLSRLPGIGRKSATRMAYFLLSEKSGFAGKLSDSIAHAKDKVISCSLCGNLTELDPCAFCTDQRRNKSILCVLEHVPDLLAVEASGEFSGQYHLLMGSISPLNGVGASDLRIAELIERCTHGTIKEVIIATNPTVDGEATALYIQQMLKNQDIIISRIASGIPVGSDLEYLDRETISRAIIGRKLLS